MLPSPVLLSLALAAATSTAPPPPAAADEPATRAFRYSAYEEATIEGALRHLGLARDGDAEGKVLEAIHTVRLEVIEARDPAPRFLNVFHVVTRSHVVEREVLLRPGDAYRQTLADETRRKLAVVPQFSLALVVPARGTAADRTRMVVITKDVWSLRLNWDISLTSGGLESLSMNPSETNLLGTQQSLGLLFQWLPESYSVGANYSVPRVLGTRVAAATSAGIIVNEETGAREGSFGAVSVGSPLWSSRTEWSWSASASWLDEVTRLYSRGRVVSFTLDPRTSCAAPSSACVPWAWRSEVVAGSASVTRSFGWATKHDFSIGVDARRSRFEVPDAGSRDAATVQRFVETRVPPSDDRVGPWAQYRTYSTGFLRVLDLETLALQEDHRLGPQAFVTLFPVLRALGSTRTLLGISAGASYTLALADGLARVGVESSNDVRADDGEVQDGSIRAALRLASPRTRLGRVVVDAVLLDRYANHLNRLSSLGGDARLRGYPSQHLVGSRVVAGNLELRSRPWQLFESLQLGGVAFYDAGDAFERWGDLRVRHAAGIGVRTLFPQLDRVVFRADLGFPLDRPLPAGVSAASFVVKFGQAFSP